MDMNYFRTLIAVADDSPVSRSVVPAERGAKKTVAVLQYEMLVDHPYVHTQPDVLFGVWLQRRDPAGSPSDEDAARLREDFFAKPQPCLRSSPLPKKYGWGLVFDRDGRVALCPMESEEYRQITAGDVDGVTVLKALRSRRA